MLQVNIIGYVENQLYFTLIHLSLNYIICPFQFNTNLIQSWIIFFSQFSRNISCKVSKKSSLVHPPILIVTLVMPSTSLLLEAFLLLLISAPIIRTLLCQEFKGNLYKYVLYSYKHVPSQFIDLEMIFFFFFGFLPFCLF